jgi:hypothetical protein
VNSGDELITRAEVVGALFALHDILDELRVIRLLRGDDNGEEIQEDLGE